MMSEKTRIKIGLDFHGVITDNPDYFSSFTKEAIARGYEIHIITGGPADVVKNMLDDWNISYTTIFAILDFYNHLGKVKYFANGEFKVEETLWNTSKARYCEENAITFHIDDSVTYAQWFSTPFCYYESAEKRCCANSETKICLQDNPQQALDEIYKFAQNCL